MGIDEGVSREEDAERVEKVVEDIAGVLDEAGEAGR